MLSVNVRNDVRIVNVALWLLRISRFRMLAVLLKFRKLHTESAMQQMFFKNSFKFVFKGSLLADLANLRLRSKFKARLDLRKFLLSQNLIRWTSAFVKKGLARYELQLTFSLASESLPAFE